MLYARWHRPLTDGEAADDVHSALEAVGFIARVATALADAGMGVNPVAGFYHDHLFVPEDRAEDAMTVLEGLARGGG